MLLANQHPKGIGNGIIILISFQNRKDDSHENTFEWQMYMAKWFLHWKIVFNLVSKDTLMRYKAHIPFKRHKCTDCPRQLAWQTAVAKCPVSNALWRVHNEHTIIVYKWIPKTDLGNHHPELVDGPMQWRFPRETHWVKYGILKFWSTVILIKD